MFLTRIGSTLARSELAFGLTKEPLSFLAISIANVSNIAQFRSSGDLSAAVGGQQVPDAQRRSIEARSGVLSAAALPTPTIPGGQMRAATLALLARASRRHYSSWEWPSTKRSHIIEDLAHARSMLPNRASYTPQFTAHGFQLIPESLLTGLSQRIAPPPPPPEEELELDTTAAAHHHRQQAASATCSIAGGEQQQQRQQMQQGGSSIATQEGGSDGEVVGAAALVAALASARARQLRTKRRALRRRAKNT